MNALLVDLGNSRLKWSWLSAAGVSALRANDHEVWLRAPAKHFAAMQGHARAAAVDAIMVSSVASAAIERAFVKGAFDRWQLRPHFVRTSAAAAGVTNGYVQAWRLGADRWAALIGARALLGPGRAACIIDVGTACTIDLLDARGRHQGGAIVPGAELMMQSLLRDTAGIQRRAGRAGAALASQSDRVRAPKLFARSTRNAIEGGAWHALAAAVDRGFEQARRTRAVSGASRAARLLTGGAAAAVRPLLEAREVRVVPEIVMWGLAAVLLQSKASTSPKRR